MPLKGSFRIDKALSNISVRYNNADYIAGKVLKDVQVKKETGEYYIYDNSYINEPTMRANGSKSKEIDFGVSTSTYHVNNHALKTIITDRDRDNVDDVFQLERDRVEDLVDKIQIQFERESHALLFTTTTFGNNESLDTNSSFNYNTTTSAPIQKVLSCTSYIKRYAGAMADTMVIDQGGFDALKENQNVHERIKYVRESILTEQLLASLFDIKSIYVGSAMYNTIEEGNTASLSNIWGNDCLIAFMGETPRIKTKNAAVNLRKSGQPTPWRVRRWREDDPESTVIEVETWFKPHCMASVSGYLLKSVSAI